MEFNRSILKNPSVLDIYMVLLLLVHNFFYKVAF